MTVFTTLSTPIARASRSWFVAGRPRAAMLRTTLGVSLEEIAKH